MKKMYLWMGLMCVGLFALPAAANQATAPAQAAAANGSGPTITRKSDDTLKFLGKEFFLFETYRVGTAYVNSYSLNGEQDPDIWIKIQQYPNGEGAPSLERYIPPPDTGHRFSLPTHDPAVTRDLRNPNDQIMSAFYELDETTGLYMVTRKIQVGEDIFVLETAIRGEDSMNDKVRRKAFQSVKNTSTATITEDFVAMDVECKFGSDCR